MPIRDWLDEDLTLIPAGEAGDVPDQQGGFTRSTAPSLGFGAKGKIEARSGQGRRLVVGDADVPISTHLATLMPALTGPDGAAVRDLVQVFGPAGNGVVNWHVRSRIDKGDYIVVAPARFAKIRAGKLHHIELELQVVGGGI